MENKLTPDERRLKWKQEKKERREQLVKRYQNAPWYIRIPRLYLLKPLIAVVLITAIGFIAYKKVPGLVMDTASQNKNAPVAQEKIEALAPIDKEGAERIDAVAPVDKNDTWTICVYLVGSDLEDFGEDDLSTVVKYQIAEAKAQLSAESEYNQKNRLDTFSRFMKDMFHRLSGKEPIG